MCGHCLAHGEFLGVLDSIIEVLESGAGVVRERRKVLEDVPRSLVSMLDDAREAGLRVQFGFFHGPYSGQLVDDDGNHAYEFKDVNEACYWIGYVVAGREFKGAQPKEETE